jgi:hypothetical protein
MATAPIHQFDCYATEVAHRVFVGAWDDHTRRDVDVLFDAAVLHGESGQGAPFRFIARSTWREGCFERAHPDGRMAAGRMRGAIRSTRAGGYRIVGDAAAREPGRDEAIVVALLPSGVDAAPLAQLRTTVRHAQAFDALDAGQAYQRIIEYFVGQGQAHPLRRELLALLPSAQVGVYQPLLHLSPADVRARPELLQFA